MEQLIIGDVVRLKSGGPKMTVAGYGYKNVVPSGGTILNARRAEDRSKVVCQWFDEKNQPKQQEFLVAVLEKYAKQDNGGYSVGSLV